MRTRLTKTSVEAIKPGKKDIYAWDDRIAGFGCKVTPAGLRVYVFKYRFGGVQRWMTLGRHGGDLTAEQARTRAIRARGDIANGKDPAAERDAQGGVPTIAQFGDRFIAEYAIPHKKPRSVQEDRRNFKRHLVPALGRLKVSALSRQDVLRLHNAMRATPPTANRTLALLSKMLNVAEAWGLRPANSNPCRGVKKFPEKSREGFLSTEKMMRLGAALETAEREGKEHPSAIAIIRLLVFTGARRSEIAALQWSHVDLENRCLRLPDSKSGAKVIRLGAAAVALLAKLPRFDSPFVFPISRKASSAASPGHFIGVSHAWSRIRAMAGLAGVRLHDARHNFASWSVMGGASLHMTGTLLGHREARTTMRYAHVASDAAQVAAERVEGTIAAALEGKPAAQPVPIGKAHRRPRATP